MPSWLLMDLRDNRCVVGSLTFEEQGAPTWHPEDTLYPNVSPGVRDARNMADLAFYRLYGDKSSWKPALHNVLDDPALKDAERIPALFDEPFDRLAKLLPVTLYGLIKDTLEQFHDEPVLALLDRAGAQTPVQQFFDGIRREAQVVALSGSRSAFAGFALWDVSEPAIPDAGRQWLCKIKSDCQNQVHCYTWKRSRFALEMQNSNPATESELPKWCATELESVGAAMYALLWRDKLASMSHEDVETLRRQLAEGEQLQARLKAMYDRLPAAWEKAVQNRAATF